MLILLAVMAVVLFGGGYQYARWQARIEDKPTVENAEKSGQSDPAKKGAPEIVVHVAGAVEKPGVYHLPRGSRVNDALARSGVLPEANLDALNLAALLTDGQKVSVPFRPGALPGENAGSSGGPGTLAPALPTTGKLFPDVRESNRSSPFAPSGGGLININTASKAELELLPGIGPALAERIIQYREENGYFMSIEDIKNVSGIGEKRFEQLKDKITT